MEPAGQARVERRLAAILAADVVGYSRRIEADEEGTLRRLTSLCGELIDPKIAEHRGRIVKTTGDGLLVEFASVVDEGAYTLTIELIRSRGDVYEWRCLQEVKMSFVLPRPKIVTRDGEPDEVILSYADWCKIVAQFSEAGGADASEDADDIAAVAAARAADAEFTARVAAERGAAVETTVSLQVVKTKLDGAHPLKAWREYRNITQTELASRSTVARNLIAQIETHKKQGSVMSLDSLTRALSIPIEALIAERD